MAGESSSSGACSRGELISGPVPPWQLVTSHAPLPVNVANDAYHRLLTPVASLDLRGDADRRLADINRVATCELWQ